MSMTSDPYGALGEYLTSSEATALATLLESGQHVVHAVRSIGASRRAEVARLLREAQLGHADVEESVAVLRAVAGAKSVLRDLTPVWTMPGNEAKVGHLTSEFHRLVGAARQSVTCATYNFESTSHMWQALECAAERPSVVVTVYIDSTKADANKVKAQLPRATVLQSTKLPDGRRVVSHAKFIVIDHEIVLVTSANFSYSAENRNVEFGLLIRDSTLAESVETTMASKRGSLYELM